MAELEIKESDKLLFAFLRSMYK